MIARTHDTLLFFTTAGQVHWLKVYDVPQMGRAAKGRAVANVLELKAEEKVSALSRQYQLFSYEYDGANNLFELDILPSVISQPPSIKVLVNNKQVPADKFGMTQIGERFATLLDSAILTAGDSVTVLVYSAEVSNTL